MYWCRQTSLAKQKTDQRVSKAYSQHNFGGEDDDDDGSKTIRVVHNSLYQSMRYIYYTLSSIIDTNICYITLLFTLPVTSVSLICPVEFPVIVCPWPCAQVSFVVKSNASFA